MSDALTDFITSPPHPLATGAVLFGIVSGLFKIVESPLADDTKLKIAVWLLDVKVAPKFGDESSVILNLFWAVCGKRSSKKRFIVLFVLTLLDYLPSGLFIATKLETTAKSIVESVYFAVCLMFTMFILDANEYFLRRPSIFRALLTSMLTVALAAVTGVVAIILWAGISLSKALSSTHLGAVLFRLSIIPLLTISIWMWLPMLAGLVLKAARRFDIGFDWFTGKVDIEKKPLLAIGLVAGALAVLVYWAVLLVGRLA
jgi:hypothetical protein